MFTIGQVNENLPYLHGQAEVKKDFFNLIFVPSAQEKNGLFVVPQKSVALTDYAIATHVSSFVKDGGTIQIGIGALGDAIAHMLVLRNQQNLLYKKLLQDLAPPSLLQLRPTIALEMSLFEQGLYANTEMLVESLLYLRQKNVLKRLVDTNAGPCYCHAGFYVGSELFYQQLKQLDSDSLNGLNMCSIHYINHLYGDEELKRQQRKEARFINSGMLLTLTGAAVSDAVADYKIVSGVGGQYNFIAQAHELEDARSILCFHSTRMQSGQLMSNIVWDYPHVTIPRHLRDIVVTEYGAADIRSLADQDVIARILNITDSRFQDKLLRQAKAAQKIAADYQIPQAYRQNLPEKIQQVLSKPDYLAVLPYYPLGSDFEPSEMKLAIALKSLKQGVRFKQLALLLTAFWQNRSVGAAVFQAELQRMQLDRPKNLKDRLHQALLLGALASELKHTRPMSNSET